MTYFVGVLFGEVKEMPKNGLVGGRSKRLHLQVPEHVFETMESLQERTGAASVTEVVRRALYLYEALLFQEKTAEVILRDKKNGVESRLLIM